MSLTTARSALSFPIRTRTSNTAKLTIELVMTVTMIGYVIDRPNKSILPFRVGSPLKVKAWVERRAEYVRQIVLVDRELMHVSSSPDQQPCHIPRSSSPARHSGSPVRPARVHHERSSPDRCMIVRKDINLRRQTIGKVVDRQKELPHRFVCCSRVIEITHTALSRFGKWTSFLSDQRRKP
jgi:hypothetical protein